jgi:hypothetical protein
MAGTLCRNTSLLFRTSHIYKVSNRVQILEFMVGLTGCSTLNPHISDYRLQDRIDLGRISLPQSIGPKPTREAKSS